MKSEYCAEQDISDLLARKEIVKAFLLDKKIDGDLQTRLLSATDAELNILAVWICELSPSANTFRDLLRLADEISARDEVGVASVIGGVDFCEILNKEGASKKEKQSLLKKRLEKKRYPAKMQIEEQLAGLRQALIEKYGIRLDYPTELEGDTLTYSFKARSVQDLERPIAALVLLQKDPLLHSVYSILLGQFSEGCRNQSSNNDN